MIYIKYSGGGGREYRSNLSHVFSHVILFEGPMCKIYTDLMTE